MEKNIKRAKPNRSLLNQAIKPAVFVKKIAKNQQFAEILNIN